jgi:hypothetical protein
VVAAFPSERRTPCTIRHSANLGDFPFFIMCTSVGHQPLEKLVLVSVIISAHVLNFFSLSVVKDLPCTRSLHDEHEMTACGAGDVCPYTRFNFETAGFI